MLSPEAQDILDSQLARVNLVQRVFAETNLYVMRGGRVSGDRGRLFPLDLEEAKLATIRFKIAGSETLFGTTFWLVHGHLFSLETKPAARKFLKTQAIELLEATIHRDPMKKAAERPTPDVLAFVALGSNLGDSSTNIKEAISWMTGLSSKPLRVSSLWRTTPLNCPPGSPDFVNAVVGLVTQEDETPESLLEKLQALEEEFGRKPKKILNEPRPLDLDLIAFGNETRATKDLALPHPRAHLRRFVLEPLAEIAPDFILPGQAKTIAQLLHDLPGTQIVERLD